MPEKKANHRVDVVRLGEPRVHTNADALELFDIGGYQVVTRKGQFKAGDLAVYIQPDSVVPQTEPFRFIWEPYSTPEVNNAGDTFNPAVGPRRRRITVRKFRKEWSEGLLMPVSDFPELFFSYPDPMSDWLKEGADVSDLLGITHWEGDEVESTTGQADSRPRRSRPRTLKGWFYFILFKLGVKGARKQMNEELAYDIPKFDVEALKNYKFALKPGEEVVVTEKIHGSQGRFFFRDGHMYAGSRNFWKASTSPCVWRKVLRDQPWIEEWCRLYEGFTLYGEVTPTQKGYRYGADDKANFFVFNIRDAKGEYLPKKEALFGVRAWPLNIVPVLYVGPYDSDRVMKLVEGPSLVQGAQNAREGIVITAADPARHERGLGRVEVKVVSNAFLEGDSK